MAIDVDKLQEFLGRFVADLGATFAADNVITGHHQRLHPAMRAERAVPARRHALGAQADEAAIRQVAADAGFTRFRRAAETRSISSMKSVRRRAATGPAPGRSGGTSPCSRTAHPREPR